MDDLDTKLTQLTAVMKQQGIAVLCLQETHIAGSFHFIFHGYHVIFSGRPDDKREYAGVGYIIAPWARQAILSFIQVDSRLAGLRMKVSGGNVCILNAYAPHNGHDFETRLDFFDNLLLLVGKFRAYGPTLILGDLNTIISSRSIS